MSKKKIPTSASNVDLTTVERKAFGFGIPLAASETEKKLPKDEPFVVLKYFEPSYQCLSEWTADELRSLTGLIDKIRDLSWPDIYKTAGSIGTKVGVGYTQHGSSVKLPESKRLDNLSPDLTFFELRVSDKARVHGFRIKSAFFLVWLDRNHRICPM